MLSNMIETKIEKMDNAKVKLFINVPAEIVNREFSNGCMNIAKKISMPGFRRGKVPSNIIKKRFGDNLKIEVFNNIVNLAVTEACKKENLSFINIDLVDNSAFTKLDENCPLPIEAVLELYPWVDVAPYTNLKIETSKYVFNEKDALNKLKEFQEKASEIVKSEDPVEDSNILDINYKFYLVDKSEPYENIVWNMNEDNWLSEIKTEIIGMRIGQEKNIAIKIPDTCKDEGLRAKQGFVYIKISGVEKIVLPPINDDLALDFGFDNIEKAKASIEDSLKDICDRETRNLAYKKIMEKITDESTFSIGNKAIDFQVDSYIDRLKSNFKSEDDFQLYLNSINKSMNNLRSEIKDDSEKNIKTSLIRDNIIKDNSIELNDDDLSKILSDYKYNISLDEAKLSNSGDMKTIKELKLYDKLMDYLLNNNEIEYINELSISKV